MAFQVPTVFTAIDKMTAPLQKMEKGVVGFGRKSVNTLDRIDRTANKMIPTLGRAGNQMVGFAKDFALIAGPAALLSFAGREVVNYQEKIQSLKAITGLGGEAFVEYESKLQDVAKSQKVASGEVAKTFEIIGSDIPVLLESAEGLGLVADAAITLSKASGDELEVATKSLTGTLNQFNLTADQSQRVINAMAAGNIAGNVSVSELAEGTDKFGAVLSGMNGTIEEAVALQEVLGKANLKGAEAGTNLRNVLLAISTASGLPDSAQKSMAKFGVNTDVLTDKSITMAEKLKEMAKIAGDEGALKDVFGKQNLVAAATLLRNTENFEDILAKVSGGSEEGGAAYGKAMELATTKTDTFATALKELQDSFSNVITGNAQASVGISMFTDILQFAADNMSAIVTVVGLFIAALVALKTIIFIVRTAMIAWNVVQGITAAIQGKSLFALRANTVAMKAHVVMTKMITAAQWLWNAAMTANPIGLIIAAVIALGVAIGFIIAKWDDWGAAVSLFLGPLGMVISIIMSFRRHWDAVVKAFKTGGILEGLKAIGLVLLDAVLQPLEQILGLINKFTGLDLGISTISGFRESVSEGLGGSSEDPVENVNPTAVVERNAIERTETTANNNARLTIAGAPGDSDIEGDLGDGVEIEMEPTI